MLYDVIGYIAAALFIVASTLTSIRYYRLFNTIAAVICAIYGILIQVTPIIILMTGLAVLNFRKLIKPEQQKKYYECLDCRIANPIVKYFLSYYRNDIKAHFPQFEITDDINVIKVACHDGKPVGMTLGIRSGDTLKLVVDYTIPKYRDSSVGKFIYPILKEEGINKLVLEDKACDHVQYLTNMKFERVGSKYIKTL